MMGALVLGTAILAGTALLLVARNRAEPRPVRITVDNREATRRR